MKKRKTIHPEIEKYKLLLESKIIESEKILENNPFITSTNLYTDNLDQAQTDQALNSFLDQLLADRTSDSTSDSTSDRTSDRTSIKE